MDSGWFIFTLSSVATAACTHPHLTQFLFRTWQASCLELFLPSAMETTEATWVWAHKSFQESGWCPPYHHKTGSERQRCRQWQFPNPLQFLLFLIACMVLGPQSGPCCRLSWKCQHRVASPDPPKRHVIWRHADMSWKCHKICRQHKQCHGLPKMTSEDICPDVLALQMSLRKNANTWLRYWLPVTVSVTLWCLPFSADIVGVATTHGDMLATFPTKVAGECPGAHSVNSYEEGICVEAGNVSR